MIKLTDVAIEQFKRLMKKEGKEGYNIRLAVIPGGCAGLHYDLRFQKEPYINDIIVRDNEINIIINNESVEYLWDLEIDYKDNLKESGFIYKNPNATQNCGCGESFS